MSRTWALITRLKIAVQKGQLPKRFTLKDAQQWFKEVDPRKLNGSPYRQNMSTLLSHAVVRDTSNRDAKFMRSAIDEDGLKRFWFDPELTYGLSCNESILRTS